MRCVVTGAAGFVGSSVSDELLARGHSVVGIDCFVDYYPRAMKERNILSARDHKNYEFIEEDLQQADLEKLFEGADLVFHLAAQAGVRASWGDEFSIYTGNNILATQRVLEAAKSPGVAGNLKKVVYASSSSVYGTAETLPTIETILPHPISPYGVTKLAAEQLMVLYASEFGVPTASVRYFTVYGPRQRPDMAFHRFIKAGLQGESLTVYGDGEQSRDFTFIADAVEATIAAGSTEVPALVCNIGGGSRVTVNQVIDQIGDIIGKKLEVNYVDRQKGDARHTAADTSLAQSAISYSPKTGLATGLAAEASWLNEILA
jgi:UDP-glucose 4-epimerase